MSLPPKDPDSVEPYWIIWCSEDGTNDGSADDDGALQGATITSSTWEVPTGLTNDDDNTDAITIHGVVYPVDTVAAIFLSGGVVNNDYDLVNEIVTNDGRTLNKTITIRVREQ